jgi:hypothetical protein
MKYQKQIDEIMDFFDFHKVQKMMEAVEWTWHDEGVPDEPDLRQTARKLLQQLVEQNLSEIGTGGFTVSRFKYEDGVEEITLRWGIEWTASDSEAS